MTKPIITLKNLKHAEFASQETHCFEATVYVDGVKFCKASNEGHGGENSYWRDWKVPVGKINVEVSTFGKDDTETVELDDSPTAILYREIAAVGKRIEPRAYSTYQEMRDEDKKLKDENGDPIFTASSYFDIAVGEAINKALVIKDIQKALRSKTRVYLKDNKGVSYYTFKGATAADREKMIDIVRKKEPKAIILTGMQPEDVVEHWC